MPNDPELGSRIATLNSGNIDAVFIAAGGNEAIAIADHLAQNNMSSQQVQYLGTGLWDTPDLARSSKLDRAIYASPSPKDRAYFENLYRNTFGNKPARIATLGFDSVALAALLAQNGRATNRAAFTDSALRDPSGFSGSDGIFRFKSNGTVERTLAVSKFENGRIREIDPARSQF
jgi:ABC-type branched-subunit amino acid transport system substrate-binding protein